MSFKGYHSKVHSELLAFERTRTNKYGVYEEIILGNNASKIVTFFPEAWTEDIIKEKVHEAVREESRVSAHEQGFVGRTSEGVLIAFWVVPNNITDEHSLVFYPLLETVTE